MGDLYVVDVSLNLLASAPDTVLAELRWHLGIGDAEGGDEGDTEEFPVWSARGPARRVGGVRIGELTQGPKGWSLTVRQEVHAESLPAVEELIERLARHSATEGLIGQIRFFEDDVPELLLNRSGTLVKESLLYSTGQSP